MLVAALQDGDGAPDTIISTATLTITSLMEHWNQSIRGRCGRVDCSRLSYKYYNSSALLTHMGYEDFPVNLQGVDAVQYGKLVDQSQRQNNANTNAESFERKNARRCSAGSIIPCNIACFRGCGESEVSDLLYPFKSLNSWEKKSGCNARISMEDRQVQSAVNGGIARQWKDFISFEEWREAERGRDYEDNTRTRR